MKPDDINGPARRLAAAVIYQAMKDATHRQIKVTKKSGPDVVKKARDVERERIQAHRWLTGRWSVADRRFWCDVAGIQMSTLEAACRSVESMKRMMRELWKWQRPEVGTACRTESDA